MGVREKIFFIYGFIVLLSFSITFKDEKVPIEMSEPEIAYSNCEERNYSSFNFLEIKNIQTFLKNENYFDGSINGYKDEFLISSIKAFLFFLPLIIKLLKAKMMNVKLLISKN